VPGVDTDEALVEHAHREGHDERDQRRQAASGRDRCKQTNIFQPLDRSFRHREIFEQLLFSETAVPLSAWLFIKAYPVRWATADLDANSDKVLIDTLELAYARMQPLRI